MEMERFDDDLNIIAGLGDDPKRDDGLSTKGFKSIFDKAGLLIQDFINNKLIPFIEKQNVGLPLGGGTMEGGIDMNGQSLSGLNAPTADDEAANKGYVDQHTNPPLPGVIYPYSGANIPDGFLLCDGAAYSRTEYAELFAAIGTMYGEGDGSTTFNVPDLVERVPAGAGDNHAAGQMVGEETHTLTPDEMPAHSHTVEYNSSNDAGTDWIGAAGTSLSKTQYTSVRGGSQPHNNMQPTTYIRGYIIATGKGSGVSVSDIVTGVQALPLELKYGGMGATNAADARKNLEITPENIGAEPVGALRMELLWENASPASEFVAQTVQLDLSKYQFVEIYFYYHVNIQRTFHAVIEVGKNAIMSASMARNYYKFITVTVDGVKFEASKEYGSYGGESYDNNSIFVPYKIYGVKGVSA